MEADEQDTLLVLAYLYLLCGEERRAVVLLLLVERFAPANVSALKALSYAYIETGMGDRALALLDRLDGLDAEEDRPGLLLIRSRALLQQGRMPEARACFRSFVASRAGRPRTPPEFIALRSVPAELLPV